MKRGKLLIVLVAVLAVFVAGYFGLRAYNKAYGDGTLKLTDFSADDVTAITVDCGGEKTAYVKDGGRWYCEDDREFPVDQEILSAMAGQIARTEAVRTAVKNVSQADMEAFGLNDPQAAVQYVAAGTEGGFLIGDKNNSTNQFYFKPDGSDTVYMVRRVVAESFFYGKIDTLKLPERLTYTTDNVVSLSVKRAEGEFEYLYFKDGCDEVYSDEYKWIERQSDGSLVPINGSKLSNVCTKIVSPGYTKAVTYAPDDAQLREFGLDAASASRATLVYKTYLAQEGGDAAAEGLKQVEATLLIGKAFDDESYYAMTEGSGVVGLVPRDTELIVAEYNLDTMAVMDVCKVSRRSIDSMDVSFDGVFHSIEVSAADTGADSPAKDDFEYTFDGEPCDKEAASAVLDLLHRMSGDRLADGTVEGEAYLTLTLLRNTDRFDRLILEFIPYDNSFYMLSFNGEQRLLVNKRSVQELVDGVKGLEQ